MIVIMGLSTAEVPALREAARTSARAHRGFLAGKHVVQSTCRLTAKIARFGIESDPNMHTALYYDDIERRSAVCCRYHGNNGISHMSRVQEATSDVKRTSLRTPGCQARAGMGCNG